MKPNPIILVGAGQAAASFVARHIALGGAPLLLIGEEPYPPYQRPPLSKKYLLGEQKTERLFIRSAQWYADQRVSTLFTTRVCAIDRHAKHVVTHTGQKIAYQKLILCTGSHARSLPPADAALTGVYTLRSIADCHRLSREFERGRRLVILGGGYIGLEIAAVARMRGLEVTLLEVADRILQRVAAHQTANYFRNLHIEHGVDVRESTAVGELLASGGRVCGVQLKTGETLKGDLVLIGIGSRPNSEIAENCGLDCDNGIAVSDTCQTSDPHIYAAGDCTSFIRNGRRIRLESVQNAAAQGDLIARVLAGDVATYTALPWFWSEQYDCKLQIAGLNHGHTQAVLRRGKERRHQSVWYYANDQLLAVDAMNQPDAYVFGKKMLQAGIHPSPVAVADGSTDLKMLAGVG